MTKTIQIASLASSLDLEPVEKTLPNGKVINTIEWNPSHLPGVFAEVDRIRSEEGLGRGDVIVFDGGAPGWLIAVASHAAHPADSAVRYPQGGPEAILPTSGATPEGEGSGEGVTFEVTEDENATLVEFTLESASVDAPSLLSSLVPPAITQGKGVKITGRGPVAIPSMLGNAYSHLVPWVASFQPGTGFVVCVSHDAATPLGTIVD